PYYLRVLVSLAVFFSAGSLIMWELVLFRSNPWLNVLAYLLITFLGMASLLVCCDVSPVQALFHSVMAYSAQHLAYLLATIVSETIVGTYERQLMYVVVFSCTLLIIGLTYGRLLQCEETSAITWGITLLLLVGILLFGSLFQGLLAQYGADASAELEAVIRAFDIMCSVFFLSLQIAVCGRERLRVDNFLLKHMLHQQKEQLTDRKETIDLINIKCHDLKHYLSQLDDRLNADEVAEIKRLISVYDTTVETGNEAVNVVLAEKIMLCEKAKICFECMVDGQSLSFMNQAELYALFGNILDNAIEAVRKLPEDADRYIDLKVSRKMGMILVHCENAYSGALQFENVLPITTKTDKRYHGYGLRSVQLLVERYNGSMKIHTSGNVFALDILLTIK
ncbi:MAG: ATP-binding protein, partial [Lachnospiraceae bacterium]|nr:ATP-binding protein [Lachnospiraceae bacterium]